MPPALEMLTMRSMTLALLAVFAAVTLGATLVGDVIIELFLSFLPYPWMIALTAAALLISYLFAIRRRRPARWLLVIGGAFVVGLFSFHASSAVELFKGNWYLTRNHAPTLSVRPNPPTVPKKGRTTIEATASDQDGDPFVFLYTVPQRAGTVGGSVKPRGWTTSSRAIYEAPDSDGRAMVLVTVRDEGRQETLATSKDVWIAVVTDEPTSNALNSQLDAANEALEKGNYPEAAKRFSDLQDKLGDLPPISLGKGVSFASKGEWDVALNDYNRLVQNQPSDLA